MLPCNERRTVLTDKRGGESRLLALAKAGAHRQSQGARQGYHRLLRSLSEISAWACRPDRHWSGETRGLAVRRGKEGNQGTGPRPSPNGWRSRIRCARFGDPDRPGSPAGFSACRISMMTLTAATLGGISVEEEAGDCIGSVGAGTPPACRTQRARRVPSPCHPLRHVDHAPPTHDRCVYRCDAHPHSLPSSLLSSGAHHASLFSRNPSRAAAATSQSLSHSFCTFLALFATRYSFRGGKSSHCSVIIRFRDNYASLMSRT